MFYLLALTSALGASVSPTLYHVSPSGNDGNPGTRALPWQTIERASKAALQPGGSLLFEGGHAYAGTIRLGAKDSGTSENYVTVGSYGEGRALINGGQGSGLEAEGCDFLEVRGIDFAGCGRRGNNGTGVRIAGGKGVRVDQVEVQGFRLGGVNLMSVLNARITNVFAHENGAVGVSVGGKDGIGGQHGEWSEDVYVGHCVAADNGGDPQNLENHSGSGIVVGGTRRAVIEYCEAMNNGYDMPRSGNGPVGIWAYNGDQIVIQFCVAYDNKSPGFDGGGFDLDGGLTNCILQYNLSYNNDGPGYFCCQYPTAAPWKNNIIRYNISQNDGSKDQMAGIEVTATDVGMSDAEIYNNTVFNTRGAAVMFSGLDVTGFRFRNNILVSATELVSGNFATNRFENNLYWMLGGREFKIGNINSLDGWREATGNERDGDKKLGLYGDPRLILPGSARSVKPADLAAMKRYRIEEGSPCIGAGIPIQDNGGRDFWGAALSADHPAIGACERVK